MRQIAYLVSVGILGIGIGVYASAKHFEAKYKQIADEEIASVKDFYSKSSTRNPDEFVEEARAAQDTPVPTVAHFPLPSSQKALEELRQKLSGVTPYGKLAKDYGSYSIPSGIPDSETAEIVQDAVFAPGDAIYVISEDQFLNERDEFDKVSVTYFVEDDVLINENENVMPNPEASIGDGLDYFGYESGNPDIVYVRNERISIDFEVVRDLRSYALVVGGFRLNEKPGLGRFRNGDD